MLMLNELREVELREYALDCHERGIDVTKPIEVRLPRGEWLLLAARVDMAEARVEVSYEPCEGAAELSRLVDPGCTCFACDLIDAVVAGKLIDLMRLNYALADTIPAGASPELVTAYEDFWPAVAIECGDYSTL